MHSTAREAARVAREAGAARLVLTHLSTRYDREFGPLVEQARAEYPGALDVAADGMVHRGAAAVTASSEAPLDRSHPRGYAKRRRELAHP